MTTPVKRNEPITLLPSYEHVRVMVAGKNHFTVSGHVLPCYAKDEGATWERGHIEKPQAATCGKE